MDIYFDDKYGALHEKVEGGSQEVWEFSGRYGTVRHQFIKRHIEGEWFDIITPYGYGGPVITHLCDGAEKKQLVREFEVAFAEFCSKNHIVSEFVRFHPLTSNGMDFFDVYNSVLIRKTVGTNLRDYDDPAAEEFSKGCQKRIRQALKKGVDYTVTRNPASLENFMHIYYATMERNEAAEFYYFERTYFDRMLEYFGENLLLVEAVYDGQVIAAGIYLLSGDVVHVHLSGTMSEYLHLSPAYVLRYALTLWAKENGFGMIHHGGGRSNNAEDTLFMFKKQFGKNTQFDFYVGKKVWISSAYADLCKKRGSSPDGEFFPAYRSKRGG